MIKNIKMVLRGAVLLAGLTACAGCNGEGSKSGDPVSKDHLYFSWNVDGDRQVQFQVSLEICSKDRVGCYSVADLDLDSADHSGRSTAGVLKQEQRSVLKTLVSTEQLEHYEEDSKAGGCEQSKPLSYTIFYDDSEGMNHAFCLLPSDDLSPESKEAIETMTEMAELLLKTGEPQTR